MNSNSNPPEVGQLTLVSLTIFFVIYPMTVSASRPLSNGGIIGFSFLLLASACSWTAFIRGRSRPYLRWILLLPIAMLVTWFAAWDGLAQHFSGSWRWF
jgi:hypothetical protein